MPYRLAGQLRSLLQPRRFVLVDCLLLALFVLAGFSTFLKAREPTVYGILDVGGVRQNGAIGGKELQFRLLMFANVLVLRTAIKDLEASGEKIPKPETVDGVKWFRERLWVRPLKKSTSVRLGFSDGTPAEQAAIINAVFRAYCRFFEGREERELHGKLAQDRARIMKEVADKVHLQPPELRRTREQHNRLVKEFIGDRLDQQKAARKQEIRAATGKLPAVVEWAQAP